jgi:hypothetical protein
MNDNIFEKHDDDFIEKINFDLQFKKFPLDRRTAGDFSRFQKPEEIPFVKVFKRLYNFTKEDTGQNETIIGKPNNVNIYENSNEIIENINDTVVNSTEIIENINDTVVNSTEIVNEVKTEINQKINNIHDLVLNQLESSNSYTHEQIQQLESNSIFNRNEKNEYITRNLQIIENKLIEIQQEAKEEIHKIDKSVKNIEEFISS